MRTVRTGFDQWFEFAGSGAAPPAAWKQDMMVLLVLYPLVYLLTAWLQQPLLVGILHLPYWLYLFINNAVGVVLLSLILPRVSRRFGWWLNPADRNRKRELAGVARGGRSIRVLAAAVLAVPGHHRTAFVIWRARSPISTCH